MKVGQIRLAQQKSIIPQKAADLLIDWHAEFLKVEVVALEFGYTANTMVA